MKNTTAIQRNNFYFAVLEISFFKFHTSKTICF